jgi:hypothetical protein
MWERKKEKNKQDGIVSENKTQGKRKYSDVFYSSLCGFIVGQRMMMRI